ncbi:MAG: hypothetical protein CM15mP65_09930 [Crocinitomicaceae bacterium]|nr:MAG: hypothetical protein CM15mP65_09930 [Crocinitomicaceae bacterium]
MLLRDHFSLALIKKILMKKLILLLSIIPMFVFGQTEKKSRQFIEINVGPLTLGRVVQVSCGEQLTQYHFVE